MTDDTDSVSPEVMLESLRREHRDLDMEIGAIEGSPEPDLLKISRLKKRKLRLKDMIATIEDGELPDIIA